MSSETRRGSSTLKKAFTQKSWSRGLVIENAKKPRTAMTRLKESSVGAGRGDAIVGVLFLKGASVGPPQGPKTAMQSHQARQGLWAAIAAKQKSNSGKPLKQVSVGRACPEAKGKPGPDRKPGAGSHKYFSHPRGVVCGTLGSFCGGSMAWWPP